MEESRCVWRYDGHVDKWFTGCGGEWWFDSGTPLSNGFRGCPFCVEFIVEFAPTEEE